MKKQKIIENLNATLSNEGLETTLGLVESMATRLGVLFPKFEQIAFYAPDIEAAKSRYKALGCNVWTDDVVTAQGKVADVGVVNVAALAFNYQLGTELELIQYQVGLHWHRYRGEDLTRPFLSHMSYHVEDMEDEKRRLKELNGFQVIQEVRTLSHTNPQLIASGQRYRYVIFDTAETLGFDVKLIERLPILAVKG